MNNKFFKKISCLSLVTLMSATATLTSFADYTNINNSINNNISESSSYKFTKEEILQLEPYVYIDGSGNFKLNFQDALINGIDSNLLDGQQRYFDYLNLEISKGNIYANKDLTIVGMTEAQREAEGSLLEERCTQGKNTSAKTNWWGISRYTCNHNTNIVAGDLKTVASIAGAANILGIWFPGVTIPATATSLYFNQVGKRMLANNKGRGVLTEITWALIFDITPQ
ncbi:MAG: hypothetical protein ACRCX2_28945 [Paraclostridium sp.]